jgi:cytidylate kinase
VIAIDGPAASGKSSTAAAVALAVRLVHIDSGAWYRALTWLSQTHAIADPDHLIVAADRADLAMSFVEGALVLRAGSKEIEPELRTAVVTAGVSAISAIPAVRDWINGRLRATVTALGGGVVDGRDIGTVVFPEAGLKVFLVATAASRAERRLRQQGHAIDPDELALEAARLMERDRLDATRLVAPLRQAPDAVEVDTTHLTFDAQVARITALAAARGLLGLPPASNL